MLDDNYGALAEVLGAAMDQASRGKGAERHSFGEPFEKQKICQIARWVGIGAPLGQAIKKAVEAERLPRDAAIRELLGAINYLAAAIIILKEQPDEDNGHG
jgi:hypothetical protein